MSLVATMSGPRRIDQYVRCVHFNTSYVLTLSAVSLLVSKWHQTIVLALRDYPFDATKSGFFRLSHRNWRRLTMLQRNSEQPISM